MRWATSSATRWRFRGSSARDTRDDGRDVRLKAEQGGRRLIARFARIKRGFLNEPLQTMAEQETLRRPPTGIIEKVEDVTPTVLRAIAGADNARLRTIAAAFVRHMHALAREVELTEAEYEVGIDFL